jgi:hypothetical protein
MLAEASLPKAADAACAVRGHASGSRCRGALDEDFGLVVGHLGCLASDSADGPSFLFEPSTSALELDGPLSMLHFIEEKVSLNYHESPLLVPQPQIRQTRPSTFETAQI